MVELTGFGSTTVFFSSFLSRIRGILSLPPSHSRPVAPQLTTDRARGPLSCPRDRSHAVAAQVQIRDPQPRLQAQVPTRRWRLLPRDLPTRCLTPSASGSPVHTDSITGRLQRRTAREHHPEPGRYDGLYDLECPW